jgi:cytochrome c-type biogenesis protein CcmF
LGGCLSKSSAQIGGYISHLGIAVILVGLIGSGMFVSDTTSSLEPVKGATYSAERYKFVYMDSRVGELQNGDELFSISLQVYTVNDRYIGTLNPGIQHVSKTQQEKSLAATLSLPTRDIFVVFHGLDSDGKLSLDTKINPLISCLWVGLAMLIIGPLISCLGRGAGMGSKASPGSRTSSGGKTDLGSGTGD